MNEGSEIAWADALLGAVGALAGTPVRYAERPVRLAGGFWAELAAFTLADPPAGWEGRLVARVMPDPVTAAREIAVQAEVARLGFPTPSVRGAGDADHGIDGRAFLVMDHARGRPVLSGLGGAAVLSLPRVARALPGLLARTQVELHALDPASVQEGLARAGMAETGCEALVARLRATAEALDRGDLVAVADRLLAHLPPPAPPVVCHGDLHPFNLLVSEAGEVAVVDWSNATVAPATYDVAYTSLVLSEPPLAVPAPLRPLVRVAGRVLARRFLRRYRAHGGAVDEVALSWYRGVVRLRALAEVAGWPSLEGRRAHPWVTSGPAFARHLEHLTGVAVRPR